MNFGWAGHHLHDFMIQVFGEKSLLWRSRSSLLHDTGVWGEVIYSEELGHLLHDMGVWREVIYSQGSLINQLPSLYIRQGLTSDL